jgi:hypothetical protein
VQIGTVARKPALTVFLQHPAGLIQPDRVLKPIVDALVQISPGSRAIIFMGRK